MNIVQFAFKIMVQMVFSNIFQAEDKIKLLETFLLFVICLRNIYLKG